jgi:GxxExxY protein
MLRDLIAQSLATTTMNVAPRRGVVDPSVLYAELSYDIVGAAIEVHKHLGPGQLEATYERALAIELAERQIPFRRQVPIAMGYKGHDVGGVVVDLIVDDKIIVELKSVATILSLHRAQVLGYLAATKLRLGLLINFNVPVLKNGVRRLVR